VSTAVHLVHDAEMLQDLPFELVSRIAREIPLEPILLQEEQNLRFACDRASVASLSLACSNLRRILTPLLFESISMCTPNYYSLKSEGLLRLTRSLVGTRMATIRPLVR